MCLEEKAMIGNKSTHLESGKNIAIANESFLIVGEGSAQEHRVVNDFFNQKDAVSTVKLLDIAQGWNSATGVARHPNGDGIMILNSSNQTEKLSVITMGARANIMDPVPYNTLVDWIILAGLARPISEANSDPQTTTIITSAPKKASAQEGAYIGMGAMILSNNGFSALISKMNDRLNLKVIHGGIGGPLSYNVEPSITSRDFVLGSTLTLNAINGYTFNGTASTPQNPSFITSTCNYKAIATGAGLLTIALTAGVKILFIRRIKSFLILALKQLMLGRRCLI
jgi:hypothetical protein